MFRAERKEREINGVCLEFAVFSVHSVYNGSFHFEAIHPQYCDEMLLKCV